MDERYDADAQALQYAPVFQYVAADSRSYTVHSGVATSPAGFAVGDQIEIFYLKSNPGAAIIDAFWQLWVVPVVLAVIGISHGLIGCILVWMENRMGHPKERHTP